MSAAQASSVFAAEGTKYGKDPVAAYYALSETPWVSDISGTLHQIGTSPDPGIGPTVTLSLLPPSPAPTAGTYANPNVTVDGLGRVTTITANPNIIINSYTPGTAIAVGPAFTNIYNNYNNIITCTTGGTTGNPVVFGGYSSGNQNRIYLCGLNPTTYADANASYLNNAPPPVLTAGLVYNIQFNYATQMNHAALTDNANTPGINIYAVAAFGTETLAFPSVPARVCGNALDEVVSTGAYPATYILRQRGTFNVNIVGQGQPLRIGIQSRAVYPDPTDINTAAVWDVVQVFLNGPNYVNDLQTGIATIYPVLVTCLGPYVAPA